LVCHVVFRTLLLTNECQNDEFKNMIDERKMTSQKLTDYLVDECKMTSHELTNELSVIRVDIADYLRFLYIFPFVYCILYYFFFDVLSIFS